MNIHSENPTEIYVPISAEITVGDIINKNSCVIQLRRKTDSQQYNQPQQHGSLLRQISI